MNCRRLKTTIEHFKTVVCFRSHSIDSRIKPPQKLCLNLARNGIPLKRAPKKPHTSKNKSTLYLKYIAESNKYILEARQNFSDIEKSKSAVGNQGSETFCNICNTDPCKLMKRADGTERNVSVNPIYDSSSDSNTIVILVDKDELCRNICEDIDNSSEGFDVPEKGKESSKDAIVIPEQPKIKLNENKSGLSSEISEEQKDDSTDFVEIEVKQKEICRKICSATEEGPNRRASDLEEKIVKSAKDESSEFCSACNAPKCKYLTTEK
ncbi:hypothetical protein Bhyg_09534 [Pseudolycoriella hygida]|uniref:Uncharacterized protein n=1 Tax=Pseudolycoriella hygida TaxID=35572 RepID=A0A9Q0S605_9DIPT|nr:hypothetical protein Bhyg_09534 [Pseudolycoriella hygida]